MLLLVPISQAHKACLEPQLWTAPGRACLQLSRALVQLGCSRLCQ